jgi:hypothetical protein
VECLKQKNVVEIYLWPIPSNLQINLLTLSKFQFNLFSNFEANFYKKNLRIKRNEQQYGWKIVAKKHSPSSPFY